MVWYFLRSAPAAAASFFSGILIDVDHFIDFYANHRFTLSLKEIYRACSDTDFKKLYLLCHSYEIVLVLWVLIALFSLGAIWKGIAIGLTQHLLLDQVTNPMTVPGYFLIYRIVNKFKKEAVSKE